MKRNLYLIEKEFSEDFDRTEKIALNVRAELLLGEVSLAEYGSYVRLCLKRINILLKAIENLSIKTEAIENINNKCAQLKSSLEIMKKHSGTKTDVDASITCNAILKSFVAKYAKYLTTSELEEATNLV